MAFKDILLTLTSYPDPTSPSVAEEAVAIAAAFGAHLTAVACEVHVEVPGHFLSGSTANIPGIIAGETQKSRNSAKAMLAAFDAAANKAGILHETHVVARPLKAPHANREIALIWRKNSPRAEEFRLLAKELRVG